MIDSITNAFNELKFDSFNFKIEEFYKGNELCIQYNDTKQHISVIKIVRWDNMVLTYNPSYEDCISRDSVFVNDKISFYSGNTVISEPFDYFLDIYMNDKNMFINQENSIVIYMCMMIQKKISFGYTDYGTIEELTSTMEKYFS